MFDKAIQAICFYITGFIMTLVDFDSMTVYDHLNELGKVFGVWGPILLGIVKSWHYFKDRRKRERLEAEKATEND